MLVEKLVHDALRLALEDVGLARTSWGRRATRRTAAEALGTGWRREEGDGTWAGRAHVGVALYGEKME